MQVKYARIYREINKVVYASDIRITTFSIAPSVIRISYDSDLRLVLYCAMFKYLKADALPGNYSFIVLAVPDCAPPTAHFSMDNSSMIKCKYPECNDGL